MKPAVRRALSARGAERRDFFRTATAGVAGAAFANSLVTHDDLDALTQNVRTASKPSELKITDLRVAVVVGAPMTCPLIRIDTNQGLVGYGEVRDGANETLRAVAQEPHPRREPLQRRQGLPQDQAVRRPRAAGRRRVRRSRWRCMDLAGKAWGVPCWQMLGGKFRDRVRLYADTTEAPNAEGAGRKLKARMDRGITYLKQDFGINLLQDMPGTLSKPVGCTYRGRARRDAPVHRHRDHRQGHRVARPTGSGRSARSSARRSRCRPTTTATSASTAASSWRGRWRSTTWRGWRTWCRGSSGELMKQIKDNTTDVPILTGEDIYLKEEFIKLIDMGAVDMIHPDLASSGGLIETKKIGDYAMEHGVAMAMHFAGTPISFMANVHCAAATENFIALEHHSIDVPWWERLVTTPKPMRREGLRDRARPARASASS